MPRLALALALAAALAGLPAHAARFTYHGDLLDGGLPAQGEYDLRLRAFASPAAGAALGAATELPAVKVIDGSFALELELPENRFGDTFVEVAVRKAGSDAPYEVLGAPQAVSKANTGCWALDGNTGVPAGGFVGFPPAETRTLLLRAPDGVAVNRATDIGDGFTDLRVEPKSGGDDDADLALVSRNARAATFFVSDADGTLRMSALTGRIEAFSGFGTAAQNDGRSVFDVDGRLRSRAVGANGADLGGGLWFDGATPGASFVGRGLNQDNYTGIYGGNAWRFRVGDDGTAAFNGAPLNASTEVSIHPNAPNADTTLSLDASASQGGQLVQFAAGLLMLSSNNGDILLRNTAAGHHVRTNAAFGVARQPSANALEVEGTASKSVAGDWAANSDRRIKRDIEPVTHALDTVLKLRPVTFRYEDGYRRGHAGIDAGRHYNVIAQEFAEVFPDAVRGSGEYLPGKARTPENEILQVDTYPAQITAIAAIQELAVQDDELRGELAELRRENARLHARLEAVLARLEARGN